MSTKAASFEALAYADEQDAIKLKRPDLRNTTVIEVAVDDIEGRRLAAFFGRPIGTKQFGQKVLYRVPLARARKFELLREEGFRLKSTFHPKRPKFYWRDAKTAAFSLSQAIAAVTVIRTARNEQS